MPGAPVASKVTFGAFTVKRGSNAPTGKCTVRVAFVEINKVALPPSKVGSIVMSLCASMVPVPPLLENAPLLNVSVAVTINVLVLLKNRVALLFLLMVRLLTVNEAGIVINVCPPTNATVPPFGLNVAAAPTVKSPGNESVPIGAMNVPPLKVRVELKLNAPVPVVNVPPDCVYVLPKVMSPEPCVKPVARVNVLL